AGKALKQLLGTAARPRARLGDVLAAIAEASPYLWDLMRADPARLLALLEGEPDVQFDAVIAEVTRTGSTTDDDGEIMRALRCGKAEAALLIALADIGGVWPVERVTQALTAFADAALGAAVRYLLRGAAAQGKLILHDAAHPEQGTGYVVLAMGKM